MYWCSKSDICAAGLSVGSNYHKHTRRGGRQLPRLEKVQGKLCFQGKRKLLKILNGEKIFSTVYMRIEMHVKDNIGSGPNKM